jgi:hypothetical protein
MVGEDVGQIPENTHFAVLPQFDPKDASPVHGRTVSPERTCNLL